MTSDKRVVERLTRAQREVLEAVSQAEYGVTMAEHYPPVKSLLARGLIAERRGRWSTTYVITDEGRAALSPPPQPLALTMQAEDTTTTPGSSTIGG